MGPETSETIIESPNRIKHAFRETFSSLKHRNFRLYFIGQIISNSGSWLTNVALTLLVLKLAHSGFAVGLLAACSFGPILLLSSWGGAIADRVDKRKMLLVTQTLEMAQSFGLAILAFMPHPPLVGLYLLAVAGGLFLAFDNPLRRSFVSEMVSDEDMPNAVVLYSAIINLSRIIGPAIAGLLIITVGYGWGFTLDALSYMAVIACLLMMRPNELYLQAHAERIKGQVRAGFRYVLSEPTLWISFLMLTVVGILTYNFGVTLPLFVAKGLHKSTTIYTIFYSVMSTGSIIAALFVARRKLVRLSHAIFGAGFVGIALLALAVAPNIIVATFICFFVGVSTILYTTATTSLVQIESKSSMRGRVLALQTVLLIGTTPIGGPIMGWLADSRGGRAPLVVGGVASIIAAVIGFYANRVYGQKSPKPATQPVH